jgi:hypothetical protein
MGAIKWTGEAFKIVGSIMTADAFDTWAKAKGKEFIERRATELSIGWFRAAPRARKSVLREVETRVASPAGKSALYNQLNDIPAALWWGDQWAREVSLLNDRAYGISVRVVPRFIVREVFRDRVVSKLAQSDELVRSYVGLPEVFLRSCADQAEEALFEWATSASARDKDRRLKNGLVLIGTDPEYRWAGELRGHYYIAQGVSSNVSVKDVQKRVAERFQAVINQLGAASREDKERGVSELRESLEGKRAYDAREAVSSGES